MSATAGHGRHLPAGQWALAALYFCSGATGLCYEVLWSRMLAAQFGASIFGVAATVAAFLLGLGIGSTFAARWARRVAGSRALGIFALLELTVALYALLLPVLNAAASPVLEGLAPQLDWWQWSALQGTVAVLLLAAPAAAMGASFPMVLRAFPWSPALLGRVYAINCLGAACGALLSLALLAELGWSAALTAVGSLGILVSVAAAALVRGYREAGAARPLSGKEDPGVQPPRTPLLAYAGVGACALMLEIGWTRLYGMVMLRTEYVLAIILAVYLVGTALGSALAARAGRARWPATAVPIAVCAGTLLGLWALPALSVWVQQQRFSSLLSALAAQSFALALFMLPVTAALGAWLPLLARRFDAGGARRYEAVALYGANCIGAAAGAVFMVLVAIPWLGTTASLGLAAVLLLCLGAANLGAPRSLLLALPLATAAAWLLREFPAPQEMLAPSAAPSAQRYRYEDALSMNHVIQAPNGQRILLTDLQRMDASSDPAAVQIQADQARLPLLLHRAPRSILFLGLGTGISAGGSLPYAMLERTAVELSPGAIQAAQTWFAAVNGGVVQAMHVEHDDARHFLAAHRDRYDVIVGDLFHPDLAGMSSLLSVEQFQRARDHLAPDGVFAQWIGLNQFDRESLHTVLRGFQRIFPHAQIFLDGMHLAMVGSPSRLDDGAVMADNLSTKTAAQADAATGKEGAATWLGRYWGPIAAGTGAVQSETRPVIEFRLPRLHYAEEDPLSDILLELLRRRPDPDTASSQLAIEPGQQGAFASAYAASELAVQSWLAAMAGDTVRARQLTRLAFEANPRDHWIASDLADDLFATALQNRALEEPGAMERILRVFPDHVESLRAIWHREQAAGQPDAASALERLRSAAPLDSEVVAAERDAAARKN